MDVDEFYTHNGIKRAYVPWLPGNNGDELMVMGLQRLLIERGIQSVPSPKRAEWAIIRGNGAMNEFWRNALDMFIHLIQHHPSTPVAVMPASYHFETTDFAALLRDRQAPCVLFARERRSFDLLRSMDLPRAVRVELDHDMALRLEADPLITKYRALREQSAKDYILVVERCDIEHHSAKVPLTVGRIWRPDPQIKARMKAMVRGPRRALIRAKWRRSGLFASEPISPGLRAETEAFVLKAVPRAATLPIKSADVSDPLKYSFHDFCSLTAGAAAVISTRLHAALLSAMLGVPTALRAGRYGKISGVYYHSLKNRPDVHLLSTFVEDAESESPAAGKMTL